MKYFTNQALLVVVVLLTGLLGGSKIAYAETIADEPVSAMISTEAPSLKDMDKIAKDTQESKQIAPTAEDINETNAAYQKAVQAAVQASEIKAAEQAKAEQAKKAAAAALMREDRSKIIPEATKHLGVPYVWGGKTPSGFDCSGFTNYVYQQVYGINIGSYTVPQESAGKQIGVQEAKPGDLIFWGEQGSTYHVGIFAGNNHYIHAPQSGDVVKVEAFNSYFMPNFAVHVAV